MKYLMIGVLCTLILILVGAIQPLGLVGPVLIALVIAFYVAMYQGAK